MILPQGKPLLQFNPFIMIECHTSPMLLAFWMLKRYRNDVQKPSGHYREILNRLFAIYKPFKELTYLPKSGLS